MGRKKFERDDMILAARRIVAEEGASRLTLAAVADRIGGTKGAIMHWFPTKDALVEAVLTHLCTDWDHRFEAETVASSDEVLAPYLRVTRRDDPDTATYGAAVALALSESPLRVSPVQVAYARYSSAILTEAAQSEDPVAHVIAWLASEGASLMATFRLFELPPDLREKVFDRLEAMSRSAPSLDQPIRSEA
ncbi:MAG: TetR family transcriptional regulator [Rhodobacteraceae bacterium]|nr:TetR family transcriptional regulator [Paracoccaceae bacterium]